MPSSPVISQDPENIDFTRGVRVDSGLSSERHRTRRQQDPYSQFLGAMVEMAVHRVLIVKSYGENYEANACELSAAQLEKLRVEAIYHLMWIMEDDSRFGAVSKHSAAGGIRRGNRRDSIKSSFGVPSAHRISFRELCSMIDMDGDCGCSGLMDICECRSRIMDSFSPGALRSLTKSVDPRALNSAAMNWLANGPKCNGKHRRGRGPSDSEEDSRSNGSMTGAIPESLESRMINEFVNGVSGDDEDEEW